MVWTSPPVVLIQGPGLQFAAQLKDTGGSGEKPGLPTRSSAVTVISLLSLVQVRIDAVQFAVEGEPGVTGGVLFEGLVKLLGIESPLSLNWQLLIPEEGFAGSLISDVTVRGKSLGTVKQVLESTGVATVGGVWSIPHFA